MKKIIALVLALCMVATLGLAFADESSAHDIVIKNTDQNVPHTYQAYQVFKGKLSDDGKKLSDIVWGNGVDGDAILSELKSSTDTTLTGKFTDCENAADVAEVLGKAPFVSTQSDDAVSGAIDKVAVIISKHLKAANMISFSQNDTTYTAHVTGDGYYFVKDATTDLVNDDTGATDTLSKYLLNVVKNIEVKAKDTHLNPDKKIVEGEERVAENSAAIGDEITFEVKIKVPDTRKYVDHFVFDMVDKLPAGMTFKSIKSVKVGEDTVPNTVTVDEAGDPEEFKTYTTPADPVNTVGGQTIKVVFNGFKAFAEAEGKNRIGSDLVVTYTAVVNKFADFTSTGNINEVKFDYSNDPNYTYTGDTPQGPMGETPKDKTKTFLTNIELLKTGNDGNIAALAGAEFEITSDDYNVTLVTGEKFEASDYTLKTGEEEVAGPWYKLKDGSYTKEAPKESTRSSYESDATYKKVSFSNSVVTPGESKKITVISGEDGKINLKGIAPGTYTIKETKAPSGYNLDSTPHTIKLTWDDDNKKIILDAVNSDKNVTFTENVATAYLTIDNKSGTVLPSTGGIGTTIFYILGGLLVVGAAVILVARRKAHD